MTTHQSVPDATATTTIAAPAEAVWHALTDPSDIAQYFFGTQVETDWIQGHPIVWRGEWQGKPYADHGTVLAVDRPHRLAMSHFSPMTGLADEPQNYHTVTYDLAADDGHTTVTVTQGNNRSSDEVEGSTQTWSTVLAALKEHCER